MACYLFCLASSFPCRLLNIEAKFSCHLRSVWDLRYLLVVFVPALVFGVAVGNTLQGAPFYFDETFRSFMKRQFWDLLNPFAPYLWFTEYMHDV